MTSDLGPANLAFDFAGEGDEPADRVPKADLAGPRDIGPATKVLLDVREVSAALGCGKTYVYELIARGELRKVKLGRLTRIPVSALAEFVCRKLESNPSNPPLAESFDAPFAERGVLRNRVPFATEPLRARRDGRRR